MKFLRSFLEAKPKELRQESKRPEQLTALAPEVFSAETTPKIDPEEEKRPLLTKTPKESILETYKKDESYPLGWGSNQVVFVSFKDDGEGIFKPKNGEEKGLRKHTKAGTYYKRERAAYLVDKFLGFGLVPTTVIRTIDGEEGSVQEFIPSAEAANCISADEWSIISESDLIKLWIFDYIIYNSDRHGGNVLVKNNGRVCAIDNGLSFSPDPLDQYSSFVNESVPEEIQQQIQAFLSFKKNKNTLHDLLEELLDDEEVEACFRRIEKVGKLLKKRGKITFDDELTFESPTI